ncbi:unnamed protein product [Microthlaspi erraticum]|uniref:Agenet domain-containing protein n=1 Tax=Microthlaspi erraticum TaxID=1685480 RepID=A0A6D2HLC0_9BRAS|nr:unnamed protein product [Microthlaspi erraticum]
MGKDESNLLRNCEIEVSSDEDGLKGAWFKAILEDDPKRRKKKLNVRYSTLQANNGSPLLETAYRKFIRPVPPENLFSTGDFEEGSVVEAAHRDGWWTGLFVKKLDDDKHLVFFDSPPDLIQFKRKQLRQHFKWTKGKWIKVKPQNKVRGFD